LRWRRYTDEAATKMLSLDHTSASARAVISSLERGMSIGIGAVGALFVLNDQMTVGAWSPSTCWAARRAAADQASTLMQEYQRACCR